MLVMLSPDHIKLLAIAELAAREAGKVHAHVEYRKRPFDWIVEKLNEVSVPDNPAKSSRPIPGKGLTPRCG